MKREMTYMDQVYRWGAAWNLSVAGILLAFPVVLCVIFGVLPDWQGLLGGLLLTAPMYWAVGVVETTSPSSELAFTCACSRALRAQGSFRLEMLPVTKDR